MTNETPAPAVPPLLAAVAPTTPPPTPPAAPAAGAPGGPGRTASSPAGTVPEKADSAATRVAKLLPADLTAAFLSAKAGLEAAMNQTGSQGPVFWTFIGMLAVSPFYFRYVNKTRDTVHISFLAATFTVFATSIAYTSFIGYLGAVSFLTAYNVNNILTAIAVVLPSLWAFVVAPTVLEKLKEDSGP